MLPLIVPYTDDQDNDGLWVFSGSGGINAGFVLVFPPAYFTIAITPDGVVKAEIGNLATEEYVDYKVGVVRSSTEGSNKQFRIIVDDSGTLSTIEVT